MARPFTICMACLALSAVFLSSPLDAQQWSRFRGPVVWGNRIFLTCYTGYALDPENAGDRDALELHVICLDLDDGKLIWDCPVKPSPDEQSMNNRIADHGYASPTLVTLTDGATELVVNQKFAILGFDPQTGKQLWTCDAIEDYIVPCVVEHDGLLYCSGGRSSKTFVVRPGGRGDVSVSHLVWDESRGANVTSPIIVDGHIYWSHDKSIALCLRASDGEEMFRERMPTRSRVYGSIVSDGSKLFLTTRDAGVLVLAAQPEYKELAINKLGSESERFNATPAIVGNRLLLRSDRRLYCV